MTVISLWYKAVLCFQLKCSQKHQVQLEKVEGLIMPMEGWPLEKVFSGVRDCSAECSDLDSWLICAKKELVAMKLSKWGSFYPEYNWGHFPAWHRLLQKQRWIQKGLCEIVGESVHDGNQKAPGVQMQAPAWLLLNSWFTRILGVWPRVTSFPSLCKSWDTGLWMDLCSD